MEKYKFPKDYNTGVGNDFLDMTPKAWTTQVEKQRNWTTSHLKSFVHQMTVITQ